jgi:hypothetical protein
MTRSKFSTKAVLLAAGIGLSTAAFAVSQPAAAQSYTCPDGLAYDPSYGCTLGGDDYGYYGYPTILYGRHADDHRGFDHGFDHGRMGGMARAVGVDRGFSAAHYGGGGFAHGMGVAHVGGFGHIGGGFGGFHGGGGFGGGGHR